MIGPGVQWPRPSSGMPPWLAAILTVSAIFLMIQALPMLAEAITPDRARTVAFGDAPPSPLPLSPDQAKRAADRATATAPGDAQDRDVTSSGGDDRSTVGDSSTGGEAAIAGATHPRGPLPVSGANAVAPFVIGAALLGGGLSLLTVVGFSGARPWPGRYVRRDV